MNIKTVKEKKKMINQFFTFFCCSQNESSSPLSFFFYHRGKTKEDRKKKEERSIKRASVFFPFCPNLRACVLITARTHALFKYLLSHTLALLEQ